MNRPQRLVSFACVALAMAPATSQVMPVRISNQSPALPAPMPSQVLVVDAAGFGDFVGLPEAIAAAPDGALLLVKPGVYQGATITGKRLRIEGQVPGAARVMTCLRVHAIDATREVSLGGLRLEAGFDVEGCDGEVGFTACSVPDTGQLVPPPSGLPFWEFPDCGVGLPRNRVVSCSAVSFVDCHLAGLSGMTWFCDGAPGEHALLVQDSHVALYGGMCVGGDGADAPGCHGAYGGAGGDAVHALGVETLVRVCGTHLQGGIGGRDMEYFSDNGCPGEPVRHVLGAVSEVCAPDHVTLSIAPLVQVGSLEAYTIVGPPGAQVSLLVALDRGWREFAASEGFLHVGAGFATFPLGVIPATGSLTRPFPTPVPAWARAYAGVELQVYARVAGQDRYSEPRTLNSVFPGL